MGKKEKIKRHFMRNKKLYALGLTALGVIGGTVFCSARAIKASKIKIGNKIGSDFDYRDALNCYVELGAGLIDTINKAVETGTESYVLTHQHDGMIYETTVKVISECVGD